jgi:MFS family permease
LIFFAAGSIFTSMLVKYMPRRVLLFISFFVLALGLFFTGPSYIIFGKDDASYVWMLFPGLALCGIAIALLFIPLLPEILSTVENEEKIFGDTALNDKGSAIYNVFYALGSILGP